MRVPYFRQHTDYTCGPASLEMVFDFFGKHTSENTLAHILHTSKELGTRHNEMIRLARTSGFYCFVSNHSSLDEVSHFLGRQLPVIIHMTRDGEGHYAVVTGKVSGKIILNDPWYGMHTTLHEREFEDAWVSRQSSQYFTHWLMVLSRYEFETGRQYHPFTKVTDES